MAGACSNVHQEGHFGLNMLLYAPIAYMLASQGEMLLLGYTMVGVIAMAPFPDIDMKIEGIRHRGPTHSVWFAALMGAIYAAVLVIAGTGGLSVVQLAAVGFASGFVGVIGHMLGDIITPMGVAPFEPISSYWKGFGWVKSADKRVNRGFMQAGVYACTAALVLGTVDVATIIDPFMRLLS